MPYISIFNRSMKQLKVVRVLCSSSRNNCNGVIPIVHRASYVIHPCSKLGRDAKFTAGSPRGLVVISCISFDENAQLP